MYHDLIKSLQVPYKLLRGHHKDPLISGGGCINDLLSIYSGYAKFKNGVWVDITDSPPCACPVITAYTIRMNDSLCGQERAKLLDYLTRMSGTRSKGHEIERVEKIVLYTFNTVMPVLLRSLSLPHESNRSKDIDSISEAKKFILDVKKNKLNKIDYTHNRVIYEMKKLNQIITILKGMGMHYRYISQATILAELSASMLYNMERTSDIVTKHLDNENTGTHFRALFRGLELMLNIGPSGEPDPVFVETMRELSTA